MKKIISIVILAVIAFSLIVGCSSATPNIKSIRIKTQPVKTTYTVGDKLDLSGIVVVVEYTSGKITEIPIGRFKTTPVNGSSLAAKGNKKVTVTYTEGKITKSAFFDIAVKDISSPCDYVYFLSEDAFNVSVETPKWREAPNNGVIQYSTDGKTWLPDLDTTPEGWDGSPVESGADNKLYFRGIGNTVIAGSYTYRWAIEGFNKVWLFGNSETLLDYTEVAKGNHPVMGESCFAGMFYFGHNLVSVSEGFLPQTTLADSCYAYMFSSCDSLISGPRLPATELADSCYKSMFGYCSSLVSAPNLPAETLAPYCYSNMFSTCKSLEKVFDLPATKLEDYCYSCMFAGCEKLKTSPKFTVDTMGDRSCNNMFSRSGLTDASGITINDTVYTGDLQYGCCTCMFSECASLTKAPKLTSKLSPYCYYRMFEDCSALKLKAGEEPEGNAHGMIFTCPDDIPEKSVEKMFSKTIGNFKGDPASDVTYYWYI